jgi:threonine aldolase
MYKAKRIRKVFGGGMRQAGFLAAAGLYALENHVDRLKEDHAKAKRIANVLKTNASVKSIMPVDTNIVIIQLNSVVDADLFVSQLAAHHIKIGRISPDSVRMVFHLDVTDEMMEKLITVCGNIQ